MYDCFHFVVYIFAFSQPLKIFSPELDVDPRLGKRSYFSLIMGSCFSVVTHHQRKKSPPKFSRARSRLPLWLYQHATH